MSEKVKQYRLFALPCSGGNVEYAASFRFARVTPDYILIYVQRKRLNPPDGKCAEIKAADMPRLTKTDEAWLFDCAFSTFADIAAKSGKAGAERLAEMVDRLEEELEAERRKEVSEYEPDG